MFFRFVAALFAKPVGMPPTRRIAASEIAHLPFRPDRRALTASSVCTTVRCPRTPRPAPANDIRPWRHWRRKRSHGCGTQQPMCSGSADQPWVRDGPYRCHSRAVAGHPSLAPAPCIVCCWQCFRPPNSKALVNLAWVRGAFPLSRSGCVTERCSLRQGVSDWFNFLGFIQ